MDDGIELHTADGLVVWAPARLSCITTYVLLEQEQWFEKEAAFVSRWLKPGMTAIDIGANHGVYALAMARAVGPTGQVTAYEPDSATRAFLERSKAANGLDNLNISPCAVSNAPGEATLFQSSSSELNSLTRASFHKQGDSETVAVTTLDAEAAAHGRGPVDFIKIDAEGEEARVVEGGASVFDGGSPLVMFEVKHGDEADLTLTRTLGAKGYGIYRLTGDGSVLFPWIEDEHDSWELNLFAAKADRAQSLADEGLLAHAMPLPSTAGVGDLYAAALEAFAIWKSGGPNATGRYAALRFALQVLNDLVHLKPTPGKLSSLARVAIEAGRRRMALQTLRYMLEPFATPAGEPFLAASARFDGLEAGDDPHGWFSASIQDPLERLSAYSSYWRGGDVGQLEQLARLCAGPYTSPEMARRLVLQMVRGGERDPAILKTAAGGFAHANAVLSDPEALITLVSRA